MSTIFTWQSASTSEVYDETQVRDDIKFGAILVVHSERVVGFLCGAWPVAVTKQSGSFHAKLPDRSWANMGVQDGIDYGKVAEQAIETAKLWGFPVNE